MQRVALITGGSRGLGKSIAGFLAAQDVDLIITARGGTALAGAAQGFDRFDGRLVSIAGDIADPEHRQRLTEVVAECGRLDWLFNNASMLGPSPQPELADYPLEVLEQVLAVNLIAPLALVQQALPYLTRAHGLIVNISSDAAVGGYAGWGGYGASKAALDLISLTLANELRDLSVGVVSVDPGDMHTRMHQEAFPGEDISDRPEPEVTLPFWAWLIGQPNETVNGQRFQAQGEQWGQI